MLGGKRLRRLGTLLGTLLLGVFLGAVDTSLVAPGLGRIATGLHVPLETATWVVSAYAIVYALSLPISGALSDRHGRRAMFIAAALLFTAGSLLSGLATNFVWLIAARALQALGGGGILPMANAEIATTFPPAERGRFLGLIGAAYGLGAVVAPPAGGIIAAALGWNWLFLVTVPLGLLLAVLAVVSYPRSPARPPVRLDVQGGALTAMLVASVLVGLEFLHRGNQPVALAVLVFAVLLVPNLVLWERASDNPIFPRGILTAGATPLALLLAVLSGLGTVIALFVPIYAQQALHYSIAGSGWALLPMALAATVAAVLGGRLTDRIGAAPVLTVGFLGLALGGWAVAAIGGTLGLITGLTVLGLGVGLTMGAPLQYVVLGIAPKFYAGSAVGLLGVFRALGVAAGPVLYGTLLPSYSEVFMAAAAAGAAGLVVSLVFVFVWNPGYHAV